jgi:hypothetical protein
MMLRNAAQLQPHSAAAAAAAASLQADGAADAQQPAVPQFDLNNLNLASLNQQAAAPASTNSNDKHDDAALFWNPDTAWGSWDSTAFEQQGGIEPSSYSIQISSFSSSDSPQQVVISGSVNGKPLVLPESDSAAAGLLLDSSSKPSFKSETLSSITDTLGGYGLSLDWGHEDAWKLVQSVEQQVEQQLTSVQSVFDSMLADATDGLVRLESLANGGLIDWQQRMLGMGWRRKLKSSNGSSSGGAQAQFDVLRLLTSRASSQRQV